MPILATGLWTVLLGLFVNTASQSFLYATLPSVGRGIGLVETQTGLILSLGAILGMLTAPAWGFLSERWGRRPVLVIAMSAIVVSPLVIAVMLGGLAATLPVTVVFLVLLCARGVQAGFGSALIPVTQAYVADVTPDDKRAAGMGLLSAAISIGTVTGAAIVWMVAGFGAMYGFAIVAGLGVIAFLCGLLLLPEPKRHVAPERSEHTIPFGRIWPFFIATALVMSAYSIVQPVTGLRFMDQFGLSEAEAIGLAGAAITAMALCMMFSQAVLAVRLRWAPARLLRVGSVGAVIGLVGFALADGPMLVIGTMAITGLALGLILPGNLAAMSLATGAGAQGKVAGINTVALGVGLAAGPLVGTALHRHVSIAAPSWLAVALLVGVSLVAFIATRHDAAGEPAEMRHA